MLNPSEPSWRGAACFGVTSSGRKEASTGRPATHSARSVQRPQEAVEWRDQPPLLQPTPSKEGQAGGVSVWGWGSRPRAAFSSGHRNGHQHGHYGQRGPVGLPRFAQEGRRAHLPPSSEPGRETTGPRQWWNSTSVTTGWLSTWAIKPTFCCTPCEYNS